MLIKNAYNLLDDVIALGDRNKKILGFLADGAFRDIARSGHILVATSGSNDLLGYLLYRITVRKQQVAIVHLCVDDRYRKKNIASLLVGKLIDLTKSYVEINLFCRRDFDSNSFWPKVGFEYVGEKKGRGKEQLPLTQYRYDHGHPDIFSQVEERQFKSAKIIAAIDANIFFNLHDSDTHPLLADWVTREDLLLYLTTEISNEIHRDKNDKRRKSAIKYAQCFPKLKNNETDVRDIYNLLRTDYPSKISTQDESDIKQVAHAAASANVSYFITGDKTLRKRLEKIAKEGFGLSIVTVDEIMLYLYGLLDKTSYDVKSLSGSQLTIALLQGDRIASVIDIFHRVDGVKRHVFQKKLENYSLYPDKYKTYTVTSGSTYLALIVIQITSDSMMRIPLFRCIDGKLSSAISFQLLSWAIGEAVEHQCEIVCFSDSIKHMYVSDALSLNSFIKVEDGSWIKINIIGVYTFDDIQQKLLSLNHNGLLNEPLKVISHTIENQEITESLYHLEKLLWPLKLKNKELLSYLIPIKPQWASELFDIDLQKQSLFHMDSELALQVENVYYRSSHTKLPPNPSRILWYVSDGARKWHNVQSIRACSYVEKVTIGKPKEIFQQLSKFGVYSWKNILDAAGGNMDKEILAFHFSRVELFDTPIPLNELKALTGRKSAPFSPQVINNEDFVSMYEKGVLKIRV